MASQKAAFQKYDLVNDGRMSLNLRHGKDEMTSFIEFLFAWGAENGMVWSDPTQEAA